MPSTRILFQRLTLEVRIHDVQGHVSIQSEVDNVNRAPREARPTFSGRVRQRLRHLALILQPVLATNYFIDAQGRLRFHHFGEGEYERSEQAVGQLLDEARNSPAGRIGGEAPKTTESLRERQRQASEEPLGRDTRDQRRHTSA